MMAVIEDVSNSNNSEESYALVADNEGKFKNLDFIMPKEDFDKVTQEYEEAMADQAKFAYVIKKYLSENFITKYICCCLKVEDRVNITWEDMSSR